MSLRDYFAAQALAALADVEDVPPAAIATMAYQLADAMLQARTR